MLNKKFQMLLVLVLTMSALHLAIRKDVVAANFPMPLRQTDSSQPDDVDIGATVTTGIQLALSEGTNQFGKRTLLYGNAVNFGSVSFINPERIINGDAYLEDGLLVLEAVINFDIIFNGANAVFLQLSKLHASTNPFHKAGYSLAINRATTATEILTDPSKNTLATITESKSIPLRLTFEISPQQQGKISDRFRLEATSL